MKKIDIKYLGIPNICFSLTDKNDEREIEFSKQRIKNGFDESETWDLTGTIGNFILPRLKLYYEIMCKIKNEKVYLRNLLKIINAFELLTRNNGIFILTEEEKKKFDSGMRLFNKMFLGLWW